jgi:hypothetical protein
MPDSCDLWLPVWLPDGLMVLLEQWVGAVVANAALKSGLGHDRGAR